MFKADMTIEGFDDELYEAMRAESARQETHLELIASENYASPRVMEAQGSVLTNKYAEGYPGKRYYGGCEHVDVAERLAIARLQQLYNCEYANVQPHSGSQANAAVFMALLNPGDTMLGMALADGGHLTHGASVNFSGRNYNAVQYGIDESGLIDYDALHELAVTHRPKLLIGGFSAYSQVVDWGKMRAIADEVGAYFMADMAHVSGLVAAGVYPSPIPHAHVVTSTTHKTLRGPRGGIILAETQSDLTKKFDGRIFPGSQGGPLMHVIAAKAVAFKEALSPEFKAYQVQTVANAKALANALTDLGYAIISGGTENHLMLVDLRHKGVTGKVAEKVLDEAHLTVNKNSIPNDPESPFVTSGIRLGTPALTTRGLGESHMKQIAQWIDLVLSNPEDEAIKAQVGQEVAALCKSFPVYTTVSQ